MHDAPALKIVKDVPAGLACRHGTFVFPDDHYIGGALQHFGEYSEIEVQFLCSFLKPGDVVVEAGAHIGTITVPMAKAVGSEGFVHAFEPQAEICGMLRDNAALNNSGIHLCITNEALGADTRNASYTSNPHNTGAVELGVTGANDVEVTTLDSRNMPRLDLLKADVEGMEYDVLWGARKTILRCRPLLYVENDRPLLTRKLLDLIFSMGYRVWRHEPWLFSPNNFRGVEHNPWPGVAALNLIAAPAENDAPAQVKDLVEILPGQWAAVCRFGGVGDNLIAAAVLPGLVRQGNRVEVITNKHAWPVFENNPYIDKLSVCADGDQPGDGGKEWQAWFEKRGHEYKGGLFHLSHSVECQLAFVQAQTQFWWRPEVRRMLANKSYVELAADICASGYDFHPLFYPTGLELAKAVQTKAKMGAAPVIAWVLCGSRFDKIYPQSAWAVARLIKELGVSVMLVGKAGKDYEIAKVIQRDVEKQNGSLDGLYLAMTVQATDDGPAADWPLRRALTQVLTCDLVITPDTGTAWACAFDAVPKIVLLSHASATNITRHWRNTISLHADQGRVPCYPCHRLHDVVDTCVMNKDKTGVACISDITVETIVQAAKQVLQ